MEGLRVNSLGSSECQVGSYAFHFHEIKFPTGL